MAPEKKLFRAIYACRRKVAGLEDEDAWRDFLCKYGGARSLRQMNGTQLGQVLDALHKHGAPRVGPNANAKRIRRGDDDQQVKMIRGLWLELADLGAVGDRSEVAIGSFVRRQTGVDSPAWLDSLQCNRVIEALKSWVARAQRQRENDSKKSVRELLDECKALWEELKALGAVTYELSCVQTYGYQATGVAAFWFYEVKDAVRLLARLRKWAGAVKAERKAAAE